MENGNEQVQQTSVNSKKIWELNFQGAKSEMLQVKSFFDSHGPGGKKFYWTDEENTQHTVRFANDSCELQQLYGFGDTGWGVQGYKCTLQFRKVYES